MSRVSMYLSVKGPAQIKRIRYGRLFLDGSPATSLPCVTTTFHRNCQTNRWEGKKRSEGGEDAEERPLAIRDPFLLAPASVTARTFQKKVRTYSSQHQLTSLFVSLHEGWLWYGPCHAVPKDKKTNSLTDLAQSTVHT